MNFQRQTRLANLPEALTAQFSQYLERFGEKEGVTSLEFVCKAGFPHPDAWRIAIDEERVRVSAGSEAGLFHGAQQVLEMMENGFEPGLREAAPVCSLRGVKIFLPEPDESGLAAFRQLIDLMCRFGYNMLMVETGGALEYRRHPEINDAWRKYAAFMNEYSGKAKAIQKSCDWNKNSIHATNAGGGVVPQSMLREMLAYCRARHIEVVPELPSLSHCDYLLNSRPELAERPEDPYPDTACPRHPGYYPLLFDLIDETIELFRPRRINLGHDEYYSIALCPRCREIPAAQLLADDLKKCRDFLTSRGIKMMIWCDKLVQGRVGSFTCGGARTRVWHAPDNGISTPETWQAVNRIPDDIEMMHWYWGLDRKLEDDLIRRHYPILFGNFNGAQFPEWERRIQAPGVFGTCCSNWGASDLVTMQRNGLLFEIAFSSTLHWGGANDFSSCRNNALDRLYRAKCVADGPGRGIEVVHTIAIRRTYRHFFDGDMLDPAADLLGYHLFRAADGAICRFPVLYGTNIPAGQINFERSTLTGLAKPDGAALGRMDCFDLDPALAEASYTVLPQQYGDQIAGRCRYPLPDDGKEYGYAGFEPVPGSGTDCVRLLQYYEYRQR